MMKGVRRYLIIKIMLLSVAPPQYMALVISVLFYSVAQIKYYYRQFALCILSIEYCLFFYIVFLAFLIIQIIVQLFLTCKVSQDGFLKSSRDTIVQSVTLLSDLTLLSSNEVGDILLIFTRRWTSVTFIFGSSSKHRV